MTVQYLQLPLRIGFTGRVTLNGRALFSVYRLIATVSSHATHSELFHHCPY